MFGPPGVAYVYLVYGMYDCLNVVAGPAGSAAAILIRAQEPREGVAAMRRGRLAGARRRRLSAAALEAETTRIAALPAAHLARGPGLAAAAFGIGRSDTGLDLCDPGSPLRLETASDGPAPTVVALPRVGVAYAGEPWSSRPWRLCDAGSTAVSGPSTRR
jgi:DNA-3-methyladenine glycosylase